MVTVSARILQAYDTFQSRSVKDPTKIQEQVKKTFDENIAYIREAAPGNFTINVEAPQVDINEISKRKQINSRVHRKRLLK